MAKKTKKKNGWELTTGLFEVLWKDGAATHIRIQGVTFVSVNHVLKEVKKEIYFLKRPPRL